MQQTEGAGKDHVWQSSPPHVSNLPHQSSHLVLGCQKKYFEHPPCDIGQKVNPGNSSCGKGSEKPSQDTATNKTSPGFFLVLWDAQRMTPLFGMSLGFSRNLQTSITPLRMIFRISFRSRCSVRHCDVSVRSGFRASACSGRCGQINTPPCCRGQTLWGGTVTVSQTLPDSCLDKLSRNVNLFFRSSGLSHLH